MTFHHYYAKEGTRDRTLFPRIGSFPQKGAVMKNPFRPAPPSLIPAPIGDAPERNGERPTSDIREVSRKRVLPPGRYKPGCAVEVCYDMPGFVELTQRFRRFVHPGFENAVFVPVDTCAGIHRTRRVVQFELLLLGYPANVWTAMAVLELRPELRPVLSVEALTFADERPNEQIEQPIFAIGDYVKLRPMYGAGGLPVVSGHPSVSVEESLYASGDRSKYVDHHLCLTSQDNRGGILQLYPAEDECHRDVAFLVAHRQPEFEAPVFSFR